MKFRLVWIDTYIPYIDNTVKNKRWYIYVFDIFDLCTFLCNCSNKLCNDKIISILYILHLILWSIQNDVFYFFGVHFVVFEAICSIHLYCAIFFYNSRKKLIANEKHPYHDKFKTQILSLLFFAVLDGCLFFQTY